MSRKGPRMSERYGPEDANVPSWETPPGAPPPGRPGYPSTGLPSAGGQPPPPPPGGPPPPPGAASPPPRGGTSPTGVPTYRSWQPGFMPLRPLNLGDLLSLPIKAIGANRQVILGGPLLCTAISILAVTAAVTMFAIEQQDYFLYTYGQFKPFSAETIMAIIGAALVYIGTDAAARTLVIPGVSRAILGERITLGRAWALSRPRLLHILLLYLLISLVAVAAILIVVGMASGGAGELAVLVGIALIPGALYLSVLAGVAMSAIVLERISAPAALSRAISLMRGSSWRLIGSFFVVSLVLYMINNAISALMNVVLLGAGSTVSSLATLIVVLIVFLIITTIVSSMIGYSFLGSVFTLMYVDLRIRNEGFDIDLARAAEAAAGR